ncbi:hypothetical protein EG329_002140 [Mollisiaceae sp. DMI_Dod_QoI]|nr:hypothetical protein EG329_002140 [Helotiales sp. DMI_Dod_QoI]
MNLSDPRPQLLANLKCLYKHDVEVITLKVHPFHEMYQAVAMSFDPLSGTWTKFLHGEATSGCGGGAIASLLDKSAWELQKLFSENGNTLPFEREMMQTLTLRRAQRRDSSAGSSLRSESVFIATPGSSLPDDSVSAEPDYEEPTPCPEPEPADLEPPYGEPVADSDEPAPPCTEPEPTCYEPEPTYDEPEPAPPCTEPEEVVYDESPPPCTEPELACDEPVPECVQPEPVPPQIEETVSSWDDWGSSKKKKKKGKDVLAERLPAEEVQPCPAVEEILTEDHWSNSWGLKKYKGKKKAFVFDEPEPLSKEEGLSLPEEKCPATEESLQADDWDSIFTSKKTSKKDKKKKGVVSFDVVISPEEAPVPEDPWAAFCFSKKEKKQKAISISEEAPMLEEELVCVPTEECPKTEEYPLAEDEWGFTPTKKPKKDKKDKKKKGRVVFDEEPPPKEESECPGPECEATEEEQECAPREERPVPEDCPAPEECQPEDPWAVFRPSKKEKKITKKDKKDTKKKGKVMFDEAPPAEDYPAPEEPQCPDVVEYPAPVESPCQIAEEYPAEAPAEEPPKEDGSPIEMDETKVVEDEWSSFWQPKGIKMREEPTPEPPLVEQSSTVEELNGQNFEVPPAPSAVEDPTTTPSLQLQEATLTENTASESQVARRRQLIMFIIRYSNQTTRTNGKPLQAMLPLVDDTHKAICDAVNSYLDSKSGLMGRQGERRVEVQSGVGRNGDVDLSALEETEWPQYLEYIRQYTKLPELTVDVGDC